MEVDEVAFRTQNSFDHQVLDFLPDDRVVDPVGMEVSPQGLQCPLVPLLLLGLLVADVGRGLLVDAVVGQVGEQVLHLRALVGVFIRGEPHKPVIVEIQPQRVYGGYQQVQAEVEFSFVNEVRPCNISNRSFI